MEQCCGPLGRHHVRQSADLLALHTVVIDQKLAFMMGNTASGSDHDLFLDRPEEYATPICDVRTLSSPKVSTVCQ